MERYRVWYTLEGYVDVDAESEEEAREEFGRLSDNELYANLLEGTKIDDVRPQ